MTSEKLKLNAKQLRSLTCNSSTRSSLISNEQTSKQVNEIYIILDNVLDTYNIGSIFRLADGVGAKKVFLCGGTSTPPNPRIKKASINTTEWVEWEYFENAIEAIKDLRSKNKQSSRPNGLKDLKIVVIEQTNRSIQYDKFEYKMPIALVVGHETYGVSKEVLEVADAAVEIPMFGVNISLNVMVSLAIVLFEARRQNS